MRLVATLIRIPEQYRYGFTWPYQRLLPAVLSYRHIFQERTKVCIDLNQKAIGS